LAVDDDELFLAWVRNLLDGVGYRTLTATAGPEALSVAREERPLVALLDIQLPGLNGYEVCRRIRTHEATRFLPVVMVTANPDQDKVAGIEAGADDFIVEPFERHELLARVRSLLRIKSYHDTISRQAAELAQLNRTLEDRVAVQVSEILALRGLGGTALFRQEGEFWTIAFEGAAFRLRDTKGLHQIAALLRQPGRELHALDLVAVQPGEDEAPRPPGGDAGPILDAQAKAQYRERLEELADELQEAERFNDRERLARATEERAALARELAGAVGLGGRDRKAASDAERARVNVTRSVKAALERIGEHSPALGRHLEATLRTGQFCSYVPDPRVLVRWEL